MSKEQESQPQRSYFTKAEAEAKACPERSRRVGKRIRSLVDFSGVPMGTTGAVTSADAAGFRKPPFGEKVEEFDVAIQWSLEPDPKSAELVTTGEGVQYIELHTGKPLVDWFSKDEYENYLEELDSP